MPLITFEGSEGCGKSTQVHRLATRLRDRGLPVVVFREPGGTKIGEAIRHLLQHSEEGGGMTAETELLLFAASRSQLVREKIKPALCNGAWVISDRFCDSTIVYQGAARNLDRQFVKAVNDFALGDCRPDLTVVLDVDRQTAMRRLTQRTTRDRMEEQPEQFYERVTAAYRDLAKAEPTRVVLINGANSVNDVEDEIWAVLQSRFPELRAHRTSTVEKI